MGTIASPTFTGTSTYAGDLQQALARAVGLASLPLTQLQQQEATLSSESLALSGLQSAFTSLQTAIQNIDAAVNTPTYSVSLSNSSVATASASASALPGTYSLQVLTLGSYATALSDAGSPVVSDPTTQNISSAASFSLTANGKTTTVIPTAATLSGLASAINLANAGVQATIVNVGPSTAPDYRLSLQSQSLGATTIQLSDGTANLVNAGAPGASLTYSVNGSPTIQSTSSQVTLAPGLQATALATGTTSLVVTANSANTATALASFAQAYNAAVDQLGQSRGQTSSPLAGSSLVQALGQALDSINSFSGGNASVSSLADLGLTFDKSGHLSFNSTQFSQLSNANASAFLGSAATSGFLRSATTTLLGIDDSQIGLIPTAFNSVFSQTTDINDRIGQDQAQVTQLQTSLTAQFATADALIASLQSQATFFNNLFNTTFNPKTGG